MMNKRGQVLGIVLIIGAILVLLMCAVLFAFGGATLGYVSETILPEFNSIGMVSPANVSQASETTLTPLNTFIQQYTWMGGLMYVLGLIAILGLAFAFRLTQMKWLAGLFVMLVLVLIISAILISNAYEEFYNGTDEIALGLQSQTLLSFMILYSPGILAFFSMIAGIILFSGPTEETFT